MFHTFVCYYLLYVCTYVHMYVNITHISIKYKKISLPEFSLRNKCTQFDNLSNLNTSSLWRFAFVIGVVVVVSFLTCRRYQFTSIKTTTVKTITINDKSWQKLIYFIIFLFAVQPNKVGTHRLEHMYVYMYVHR